MAVSYDASMEPSEVIKNSLPSCSISGLQARRWDALVLGAGPAGALAARMLALRGFDVLLLDKGNFPRGKVCGCCLNSSAFKTLADCGLAHLPESLNARALNGLQMFVGGASGRIELSGARVLSREAFDAALVSEAVKAGAHFLPGAVVRATFTSDSSRCVRVQTASGEHTFSANFVFAATGLNSAYLDGERELDEVVSAGSRMGLGATIADAPKSYSGGTVFMACAEGGYAGMVRLEDGRLNIAAALDAAYLRGCSDPGAAISGLLLQAGAPPIAGLKRAHWHGTPLLTRRRKRVSAPRLWVLGDAAGYVEPFTGEGMAWAMLSGMFAAKLAPAPGVDWNAGFETKWSAAYGQLIRRRQLSCKIIARILRVPRFSRAALGILQASPAVARAVLRCMDQPAAGAA